MATLSEANAAYQTNADWRADSSLAKAYLFQTALRQLINLTPTEMGVGPNRTRYDETLRQYREELKEVSAFIKASEVNAGTHVGVGLRRQSVEYKPETGVDEC